MAALIMQTYIRMSDEMERKPHIKMYMNSIISILKSSDYADKYIYVYLRLQKRLKPNIRFVKIFEKLY